MVRVGHAIDNTFPSAWLFIYFHGTLETKNYERGLEMGAVGPGDLVSASHPPETLGEGIHDVDYYGTQVRVFLWKGPSTWRGLIVDLDDECGLRNAETKFNARVHIL